MADRETSPLDIELLFRAYYGDVVRLALSILEDGVTPGVQDEAEDAAQDTFIAAARSLEGYQGLASARTWLFAIAINICRDRLRRRKARRLLRFAADLFQRAADEESIQRQIERGQRDQDVWDAILSLDEKHRLPVLLHYAHQMGAAEIAAALGIAENTVHSRLYYARRQIEGQLTRIGLTKEAVQE